MNPKFETQTQLLQDAKHHHGISSVDSRVQGDAFGVLGVWPAAWVAAQRVPRLASVRCQWVVTRGGRKET